MLFAGLHQTVPETHGHVHRRAAVHHLWKHRGHLSVPEEVPEMSREEVQQGRASSQRNWLLLLRACTFKNGLRVRIERFLML